MQNKSDKNLVNENTNVIDLLGQTIWVVTVRLRFTLVLIWQTMSDYYLKTTFSLIPASSVGPIIL